MSSTQRRSGSGMDGEAVAAWATIGTVVLVVGTTTAAAHLARAVTGGPELPANPAALAIGLVTGTVAWSTTATVVTGALVALELAALAAALAVRARARRRRSRVDVAARHMGRGRALEQVTARGARVKAETLGVTGPPGVCVGRTVATGARLYMDWESVGVHIRGPRTGKTSTQAIPTVLDAPGPVLATSNKRDLLDTTRGFRSQRGSVWAFDPQGIVGEEPTWWWNPLTYVTDEVQAIKLSKTLVAAAREPGARVDAYFDKAGPSLIAGMLHAAALADRPITQVYLWLSDPRNDEPALILRDAGFPLSAAAVEAIVHAPDKQRGGVYGTAQELMSFLISRSAARWVTADPRGDTRRQFRPDAFVRSTDTLYLLSREGEASTGPLVTALTAAVTEAAEDLAKTSPGGRLPVPMVAVLDEAANVCRWHNLPDLYSHFGSRGILVLTFLQSWSQGVEVWGREGMRKLWSAANLKAYGGGVSETEILADLVQLIGRYRVRTVSATSSRNGRSRSFSETPESILDVADLAALPPGRMIAMFSGTPAVLARTIPWWEGEHAAAVRASASVHGSALTSRGAAAAAGPPEHLPTPDAPAVVAPQADNPWTRL